MRNLTPHVPNLFLALIVLLLASQPLMAQVGIGTTSPNANAILDLTSTDQGFLPPRLDRSTITGLGTGEEGLMLYDDNAGGLYFWDGSSWQELATAAGASLWNTNGTGIDYTSGNVGIGTDDPNSMLELEAGNLRLDADQSLLSLLGDLSDSPQMIWTGKRQDLVVTQAFDITAGMELSGGGTNLDERQLAFRNDDGDLMVSFVENGSVGIGEAVPAATLDVNGSFQLQTGTSVNEITIDGLAGSYTDDQLMTAKAVADYVDDNSSSINLTTFPVSYNGGTGLLGLTNGGSTGDMLTWDGAGWSYATPGGDIGNTIDNIVVTGIQGFPVDPTTPNADEVLMYDGTDWVPTPSTSIPVAGDGWGSDVVNLGSTGALTGDGTAGNPLDLIVGTNTDDVLTWNGTEWEPQPVASSPWTLNSPDLFYNAAGAQVGIGTATPNGILDVESALTEVYFTSINNTPADGTQLRLVRTRGTSGSPARPQGGDMIGAIDFAGYDGAGLTSVARMSVLPIQDFSLGESGSIIFETAESGALERRMAINADGSITMGNTGFAGPAVLTVSQDNAQARAAVLSFNNTPSLSLGRSGDVAANFPTAVPTGVELGVLDFVGDDGAGFHAGAGITAVTTEPWATGSYGSQLEFRTVENGTGTPVTRLTIMNDGILELPTGEDRTIRVQQSMPTAVGNDLEVAAGYGDVGGGNLILNAGGTWSGSSGNIIMGTSSGSEIPNVGIGVDPPLANLHVNGDFRLENGVVVNTVSTSVDAASTYDELPT
ncbi:MAG: hypothetical protein ACOCZ8_05160, partial [Bacteroidota bacterium]